MEEAAKYSRPVIEDRSQTPPWFPKPAASGMTTEAITTSGLEQLMSIDDLAGYPARSGWDGI